MRRVHSSPSPGCSPSPCSEPQPSSPLPAKWQRHSRFGSSVRAVDLQLTGRRAVVTGASRGIGFAIGRALATEGAAVALVSRDSQVIEQCAARLRAETGAQVAGIAADTGDDASVAAMAKDAARQLGGVDILVNNAATMNPGTIPEDQLEAEINVKVRGYLRCVRAFAPAMAERGWGRIINIGGLAA